MLRIDDRLTLTETPGAAGVDEVGRGPLAGPVVAAAVVLPEGFDCRGLRDSKTLTAHQRLALRERIVAHADWALGVVGPDEVDRLNVLEATMEAMRRALAGLRGRPREALIDGNRVPYGLRCPAVAIVKGDGQYASIAAASIVAKVARDEAMVQFGVQYPRYGFERHFGYPTPEHLRALTLYGPSPIHRRSFAPVRSILEQPCLALDV